MYIPPEIQRSLQAFARLAPRTYEAWQVREAVGRPARAEPADQY
jgi:hypothetical protein